VATARRRVETRADTQISDQEAELLLEAIHLLAQRQQETEIWAAERIRLAEERATAAEQRQTAFEAQLAALEGRVAALASEEQPTLIAGTPEERLARLREQVEELRLIPSGTEADEPVPVPTPVVAAPTAPAPTPPASSSPPPAAPTARTGPSTAAHPPATSATSTATSALSSAWQRFEQMPRGQMEKILIVVGVLIVVYAGLWQIAMALGFA
jgi:hypothetical protein